VNRALAAALCGLPLALALGAGSATAQPPVAPPIASVVAPLSAAPAYPGLVVGWGFDNAEALVAISCARTTDRPAWVLDLTQQPLLSGGTAGFSKGVPVIDTSKLGQLVEWAAYGPGGLLIRSGCLDSAGQRGLHWGDPIISERAVVKAPPAGSQLSILPGEPASTPVYAPGPPTTPAPATTTTEAPTTAPAPVNTAPAAPAYTGTPAYSGQSNQPPTDSGGGGTPWAAIFFGLLTLAFAAVSRYTSWRVRREGTLDKIPLRGHIYGILAALMGLISAANAPTSVFGFLGAAVLAVVVALVLAAQRAAHSGHRVSLVALVQTARSEWPAASTGTFAGLLLGYFFGSGLMSPGALYGLLAGAGVGLGTAHLRKTKDRVATWQINAALVADVLGIRERDITETAEVVFSTTPDGGFVATELNQAARGRLDDIESRCAQVAPYLMVTHADRLRVVVGPVDDATAAHRESMAASGGLVGGAHAGGTDPWTGGTPAPSAGGNGAVDMHKPGASGGPDVVDLSQGWD